MGCETLVIGCGNINSCRTEKNPARIVALDNSLKILEQHAIAAPTAIRVCADSSRLPFKENSFNTIEATHVVEHLTHSQSMMTLTEVKRTLKQNGVAIIATPHPKMESILVALNKKHHSDHMHLQVFSLDALKSKITEAGLNISNTYTGNARLAVEGIIMAIINRVLPQLVRHSDQTGLSITHKGMLFSKNRGIVRRFLNNIRFMDSIINKLIPYENVVVATK